MKGQSTQSVIRDRLSTALGHRSRSKGQYNTADLSEASVLYGTKLNNFNP